MVRLIRRIRSADALRSGQRGAAMILTAAAIFGLLAVSALVVDIGNAYQRSRSAQSVADASSLAGAWDLISDTTTAKTIAAAYVADNLDATLPLASTCVADSDVTVDTTCYSIGSRVIEITSPWEGSDYLIRVDVCDAVTTSFASLVGFDTLTVCRYAIAQVDPPTPGSPAGPAIQTFSPGEKHAFETSGDGTIWTDGNIFIGSNHDAAITLGSANGVTVADGGEVWFNVLGGCLEGENPPTCGDGVTTGFIGPVSTCDPTTPGDCPDDNLFDDVYAGHAITDIDVDELAACLDADFDSALASAVFPGALCNFYDPGAGYGTHAERSGAVDLTITGATPDPKTDPTTCGGSAFMDAATKVYPGHYGQKLTLKGCIWMQPGIYLVDGGFIASAAWLQGNDVLIIDRSGVADPDVTGFANKITSSKACLTSIQSGNFVNFLFYLPGNSNTFDVESDAVLILQGIVYAPEGFIRIQGADASTVGGNGSAECLGVTVTGGGSIVGTKVKVKSDGTLSIHALEGGAATGGGQFISLWE